ncbi:MAG TPA: hydantoinase/oxoprolinase family protein [Candidatus Binatia bacterium]|nr:hydantoinase/oxoprolinase family protein [Candidatus Binatia bacterium]
MNRSRSRLLIIGVDTGGTFTDIVYRDGAATGRLKLLSTPQDPAKAVLEGLERLFGSRRPDLLTYGTTVATNAMLERRGVRTALVTTAGFEDVIEIGRQARPDLYDPEPQKAEPLVPRALRIGVAERTLFDGQVQLALTERECRRVRRTLQETGAEAVAVCFLHSHVRGAHEQRIRRALASLGVPVTLSHQLSPVAGEYERSSTAVANAYVQPRVQGHIRFLARASGARTFRVMQSNGGAIGAAMAAREPVRTMLSGPAGGVAAAAEVARRAGIGRIVTLDMGGTSTDVAFVEGEPARRAITEIGGFPLRVPCLDIHTVGAGGGSIARIDPGGALIVGPQSAGADPGPACYGRGVLATVTDANVVLGRLPVRRFLGGTMDLDLERARAAVASLGAGAGTRRSARRSRTRAPALEMAAEGIVRVIEGNMERAIRVITVQRGEDPRTCTLVPFGGAAGLHACGLAELMAFADILIPAEPGLLSARGVLDGRVVVDRLAPLHAVDPSTAWLERKAVPLQGAVQRSLAREGFRAAAVELTTLVRARYRGQNIELEVPLTRELHAAFDRVHAARFHSCDPSRPLEVVGLRVTGSSRRVVGKPARAPRKSKARAAGSEQAYVGGRVRTVPLYVREDLGSGAAIAGPAIVAEYSSTTWVAPGWTARVDGDANLRMSKSRRGTR